MSGVVFPAPELFPKRAVIGGSGKRRFNEDAVVTAQDLRQRVPDGVEEVFVGGDYFSVQPEFDHRLRLADGRKLTLEIGGGHLLVGYVGGIFYHLERLAAQIEDRVVTGLQPDLAAAFADPLVVTGVVFPAAKFVPEQPIVRADPERGIYEHAVMLTANFFQRVTKRGEEVIVRGQDLAIQPEFDDRLCLADRRELTLEVGRGHLLFSDVGGIFHHLERLAAQIENRIVASLDPNLAATFADPLILPGIELAAAKLVPEQTIVRAGPEDRIDEQAVMLTADFLQRIAKRGEEVFIREQDFSVHPELDHCLRLADRRKLALEVCRSQLLFGDVGGIFDHLEWFAVHVDDRVVTGLQPDLAATLADPLILARIEFPAAELVPEQAIFRTGPMSGIDEHAVMLAPDFLQRITKRGEEVFVRRQDFPVGPELDHRLRLADGRELALEIGCGQLLFGDVGGIFHYLERLAAGVENRVVAGLQPDLATALGKPLVVARVEIPAAELVPEQAIFRAAPVSGIDKHAVMLAADLLKCISERGQEVFVRGQNLAIQAEFDHGLDLGDRRELALEIGHDQLLLGDVGDVTHDLKRLAVLIENRGVDGLAPELAPALGDSFVRADDGFPAVQLFPEQAILGSGPLGWVNEHAVVLAADFLQGVADPGQKILVRGQDFPVHTEFDHRLYLVDRAELALVPCDFGFVGGDTEQARDLAVVAGDRHEGDPQLQRAVVPRHMLQPRRRRFAARQPVLQLPKHRSRAFCLG